MTQDATTLSYIASSFTSTTSLNATNSTLLESNSSLYTKDSVDTGVNSSYPNSGTSNVTSYPVCEQRPPVTSTVTVPVKQVYASDCVASLSFNNVVIPVDSVSAKLDIDSWVWVFMFKLLGLDNLSLVPALTATPKVLTLVINGYSWSVIAEKVTRSREFGNDSITISGRGITALLDEQYQGVKNYSFTKPMSVSQIVTNILGDGWVLVWDMEDWIIPEGTYSAVNKSPIQAIADIVSSIGGVIIPDKVSRKIRVTNRYPVRPWDYVKVSPRYTIPINVISTATYRPKVTTKISGVYVFGSSDYGVLAKCSTTKVNGITLESPVSNDLLTDIKGCISLGSRIISGHYTQPSIQEITTILSADVPLFELTELLKVVGTESVTGMISSVTIASSFGSVQQSITLGEDTSNSWTLFKKLVPTNDLLVGKVVKVGGGFSSVLLHTGGVISVKGVGTVGTNYFVRDKAFISEAPNKPVLSVAL